MSITIKLPELAELVALKARLADANELTLLGIERALVEIDYAAKMHVVHHIELWMGKRLGVHDDGDLKAFLDHIASGYGAAHEEQARDLRDTIHGHLIERHGAVPPLEEVWPPEGSLLATALERRRRSDARYREWRDQAVCRARMRRNDAGA